MRIRQHAARASEIVAAVAGLLSHRPEADEDEVVHLATANAIDSVCAEIAVVLLPVAFGRALIREQRWGASLPDEISAMVVFPQ